MKYHSSKLCGLTLIEVIIYAALLSFLITGFVQYAYWLHGQDLRLLDDINDQETR